MITKKLAIPLCDIKSDFFEEMSPLGVSDTFCPDTNNQDDGNKRKRVKVVQVLDLKSESDSTSDEDYNDYGKKCNKKGSTITSSRKKVVRVVKSESESESSSDEVESNDDAKAKSDSTSDEDYNDYGKKSNGTSSEEEASDEDIHNGDVKSEYEKMIEKNRAEHLRFIASLKIDEAKSGLMEVVSSYARKQSKKRVFKQVEKTSPPVTRKSRRLANKSHDFSEDALFSKAIEEAQKVQIKKVLPPELPFKEALDFEELYDSFNHDINIQESKTENKSFSYNKSVIQSLNLIESNIARVTPVRITSLAWYPSAESFIIAGGDKHGGIGVWNVDSESSPYVLRTHLESITNLEFNPSNNVQLVSSSYDGTLRSGDMVKHVFSELYNISDEACCTYFDFLSPSTYIVAQTNGQVALVDSRTGDRKRCEKKHTCHDYFVKTVSMHPLNKCYFLTAENRGSIRLWDLRKLQAKPVADITHHKRCVTSAYFSPVTGNAILTTSSDDTICIFDSTNVTDIPLIKQLTHNNHTGRWLTTFKATWLPNSDEAFVVGSMQHPRRIQVFDVNMNVHHIIMHNYLNSIASVNAFHPSRPALAGANGGGKIFAFT